MLTLNSSTFSPSTPNRFVEALTNNELILNTLIATGSRENLSADLLVTYLKGKISEVNMDSFVNIKREEMYILKNNKYIPLYKGI